MIGLGASAGSERKPISVFADSAELCIEFGPAIGMYFRTVETFAVTFLLISLCNMPSILHFASDAYSHGTASQFEWTTLWGSAACANNITVPAFENYSAFGAYYDGRNGSDANSTAAGAELQYLRHNECYLGQGQYVSSIAVVVVLILSYAYFYTSFARFLVRVDERRQTASDYTIVVNDPPVDAYDPAEWVHYFKEYGKIAAVSILVDNGDVLERLARRRALKLTIEGMPDDEFWPGLSPGYRAVLNTIGVGKDKISYLELYQKNECELTLLLGEAYLVRKVYVTFEMEAGQRNALATLQQGTLPAALDVPVGLTKDKLFRSWRSPEEAEVLDLAEAVEPEEIFFQNTGLASDEQQAMQRLVMLMFLALFCGVEFAVVSAMEKTAPQFAGLIITIANSVIPESLHVLSGLFEVHETDASKLESVYNKISFFRYFNTVIIIHLITDWSHTLDADHLGKIQSILIFDAFLTPFLYAFNVAHYFNRWVVSKLVTNEFELQLVLSGARIRLSDRYSNLAKCMFVGLFYLPLLPTGAFLAFLHCALSCLADRIGLVHQWKPMPPAGAKTLFNVLSTHVAVAILTHFYMAGYFYSGWSYDGTCAVDANNVAHYTGGLAVMSPAPGSSDSAGGAPASANDAYYQCDRQQEATAISKPLPWMSDVQADTVLVYQVVFIAAIVGGAIAVAVTAKKVMRALFVSSASFDGDDQGVSFYDAPGVHLYVPKYDVEILKYPLVACNIESVNEEYISWNSEECAVADYSIYRDVQQLVKECGIDPRETQLFSTCTQYKRTADGVKQTNQSDNGATGGPSKGAPGPSFELLSRVRGKTKAIV
jgi:hypothetical protein